MREKRMTKKKNYQKTLIACYLGFITQAISANFTPLLFLTFKDTYGISLEMLAVGPTMVGGIAESVDGNLKTGLLFATVFPIAMSLGLIILIKNKKLNIKN